MWIKETVTVYSEIHVHRTNVGQNVLNRMLSAHISNYSALQC
jgi:hypothetical protein